MSLRRRFQAAAKQELREYEAINVDQLFTNVNMSVSPTTTPQVTFEPEQIQRNLVQGTLTPSQGMLGRKLGRYSIDLELLGTSAKPMSIWMQSCGFRESAVAKVKITTAGVTDGAGSAAAILRHGTKLYYGTPSGGTLATDQYCTVIGDYYGTADRIIWVTFAQLQGQKGSGGSTPPAAGDTMSNNATVASATAKVVIDTSGYVDGGGIAWYPMSTAVSTITFTTLSSDIAVGDFLYGVTSKATAQALTSLSTSATIKTVYVLKSNGTFQTGETIANLTLSDLDVGALLGTSNFERQDAGATFSFGVLKDPVKEALFGVRSNLTLTAQVGRPVQMHFEGNGVGSFGSATGPYDGSFVTGITFPSALPPIFRGANIVLGRDGDLVNPTIAPCIRQFTFQTNNTLALRECANAASGALGYEITARAPGGTFDPDLFPEGQFGLMGMFLNNYSGRISFQVGGTASTDAYNRFWVQVPIASISAIADGDANGRATRGLSYLCTTGSAGYTLTASDKDIVIIQDTVPDQLG